MQHDPTNRLRARGNAGGVDIEANTYPQTAQLHFNGITDVYTFRYDGFAGGDFIKLQLNGSPAPAEGASIGGFLFDVVFEPNLSLPASGDYNGDQPVDAADYVVWRKSAGESGFFLPADGNPDNQINGLDYHVWAAQYGETSGSGDSQTPLHSVAVPEGGGIGLLLISAVILPALFSRSSHVGRLEKSAMDRRLRRDALRVP
jgi:hypothetical protein